MMIQSATQTNDYGHLMGYEFLPGDRTGTGRFSQRPQDQEIWTQHDEYLTNDNPGEDGSGSGTNNWRYNWYSTRHLSAGLSERRTDRRDRRRNRAVVHLLGTPRADRLQTIRWVMAGRTGITLIHWSGFDMEPHNLFDYNPLGGPPACNRFLIAPGSWCKCLPLVTGRAKKVRGSSYSTK